jgi:hypothetical protein
MQRDVAVGVDVAHPEAPPGSRSDRHLPAVTDGVTAWPGGVGQQLRDSLDPPVDRDVVDLDTALGEQLLDVAERGGIDGRKR